MTTAYTTGNDYVDAMGMMAFEGNVIPWSWYTTLRLPSGKPDLIAIMILADVVYWYRPAPVHDEHTGQVLGWKKKFGADLLQRSHEAYIAQFGFTPKQIREALHRLESIHGVIRRERRTIETASHGRIGNVLFLAPVIEAIQRVTHPRPLGPRGNKVRPPRAQGLGPVGPNITESVIPEISTKISHKCLTDGISVRSGPKRTKSPLRTHRRSGKTAEHTGHYLDMPDDPNKALVTHCLDCYYDAYYDWKGRAHPKLKDAQLFQRQTILSEAFDRLGIDCKDAVEALVATYWSRSFVKQDGTKATDRNLNAFATEAVLDHLAQTLMHTGGF